MSKLLLKGNASGTGTITLETPNTNTDQTITLPNSTATIVAVDPGTSGNVLTSNGSAWTSAAAAAFDTGTRLMFAQDTAPTGWTKDTTNYDNHAIRVVTGTAGTTGGSVDFSTAFTSQTPAGSISIDTSGLSAGATTLTESQIPGHRHYVTPSSGSGYTLSSSNSVSRDNNNCSITSYSFTGQVTEPSIGRTSSTGGGSSHSHSMSGSATGSFTGTAINLAVKYLNVITATKN